MQTLSIVPLLLAAIMPTLLGVVSPMYVLLVVSVLSQRTKVWTLRALVQSVLRATSELQLW